MKARIYFTSILILFCCALKPQSVFALESQNSECVSLSPNLLQNSTFAISSNGDQPDYWGPCWHSNKHLKPDVNWYEYDGESPVNGTRSIVFNKKELFLQSYILWIQEPEKKNFTFSCYLKAEKNGDVATLHVGNVWTNKQARKTVKLTKEWKRYVFSVKPNSGHHYKNCIIVGVVGGGKGRVWLAAPQLEEGIKATPYSRSVFDLAVEKRKNHCVDKLKLVKTPPKLRVGLLKRPLDLNGGVSSREWSGATLIESFVDSYTGKESEVKTKLFVGRDSDNLYLGFVCMEPNMDLLRQLKGKKAKSSWSDDYVKIIIAPNEESEYASFISLNPYGVIVRSQNTSFKGYSYKCELNKNSWTAEVQIPFNGGNIFTRVAEIRANFYRWRNRRKEILVKSDAWMSTHALSSWSPTFGSAKTYVRFGSLFGFDYDNVEKYLYFVEDPYWLSTNDKLFFITSIESWRKKETRLKLTVKAHGTSTMKRAFFPLSPKSTKHIRVEYPPKLLNENGWGSFSLFDLKIRKKVYQTQRPFYKSEVDRQFYALTEYDYYTDDKEAVLGVFSQMSEPIRCEMKLFDKNNCQIKLPDLSVKTVPAISQLISKIDISNLKTGRYTIRVSGVGKGGLEYACEALLRKHSPAGNEIRIDQFNGALTQNGKGILSFGLFADWSDDVRDNGFNTQMWFPLRVTGNSIENAEVRLAALRENGNFAIPKVSPLAKGYKEAMLRLRENPAILAINYIDEPYGKTKEYLLPIYKKGKEANPYQPLFFNLGIADWKSDGRLKATDIGSMSFYPFCFWSQINGAGVVDVSRTSGRMKRDCIPLGKAMGRWNQFYSNDDAWRYPSSGELRAMTYLDLINGTRIFYYFAQIPGNKKLWDSMKSLGAELRKLQPILTSRESREIRSGISNGAIRYSLWSSPTGICLIACNPLTIPVTFSFDLKNDLSGEFDDVAVLFEGRTVKLKKGVLRDSFAPLERHVYFFGK